MITLYISKYSKVFKVHGPEYVVRIQSTFTKFDLNPNMYILEYSRCTSQVVCTLHIRGVMVVYLRQDSLLGYLHFGSG